MGQILDPLTGQQWEPKHPVDTVTARILLMSVRELFLTRLQYLKTLANGKKFYRKLDKKAAADMLWVMKGRGRWPYTVAGFCSIFGISENIFRAEYLKADADRFAHLLRHWTENYGLTV